MKFFFNLLLVLFCCIEFNSAAIAANKSHNIILFVPDGLRALMVRPDLAPTMSNLRE